MSAILSKVFNEPELGGSFCWANKSYFRSQVMFTSGGENILKKDNRGVITVLVGPGKSSDFV
jgi:hypothetical protein